MKNRILLVTFAALAASAASTNAQSSATPLRLARLFSDHMIVQRDARVPVWGWAAPGARVTARLDALTASATADSAGRWRVSFAPLALGGTHTLTVDGAGGHIVLRDIVAGDVWVASGQSNMEFHVGQANAAAREIASAHDSLIRHFKVPITWSEHPEEDVAGGSWEPADSQHVGAFSAVGYFFARDLRRTQRIPIGILNTTWGGSAIETWIGTEAQGLAADVPAKRMQYEQQRLDSVRTLLVARYSDLPQHDPGLVNGTAVWAAPGLDDSRWTDIHVPGMWENAGFPGVDGVGWYRVSVALTADEASHGARLVLGAVDDDDITYVNGAEVGRTVGAGVPRSYAVPASAFHAGINVIAVRVFDSGGDGGIGGSAIIPHLAIGDVTHPLPDAWKFRIGELSMQIEGMRVNKIPAITYNRMVHPLLPLPIKGVIWYQGESNANSAAQATAYRTQLPALITSWRRDMNAGRKTDFPFLWVQLPNYGQPDSVPNPQPAWALVRESMTAALTLPHTGQAITIDGSEGSNLHPKNKQIVGSRLALVGRSVAYGEHLLASGPTYHGHSVRGNRVVVTFDHRDGGLMSKAADGSVGAFAIAGADRRFVWAHARIEGDRVVVWSDEVKQPVAVRYAWANDPPDANLYNRADLPATPFRTDAW